MFSEANTGNEYNTGFFSSEYYASNLIKYFMERTSEEEDKPFFAFLPFSAPHWPLQCSKADRERYKGVYDEGPEVLRQRRLGQLKKLGLVNKSVVPHEVYGEDTAHVYHEEWENLSDDEKAKSARSMECCKSIQPMGVRSSRVFLDVDSVSLVAGMVDNMDQNIGRVLDYLESTGELDSEL